MSYYPPITSIQDYNQWAIGCGCDCALPGCADPVIESQSIPRNPCVFVRVVEGCTKYYRTRTRTQSVNYYNASTIPGSYWVQAENWQKQTINTIDFGPDGCVSNQTCTGSGTQTFHTFFAQTRFENGQAVGINGPFPQTLQDGVLTVGDGLPDPTWSPGPGQTEDDRPLMPPCTLLWTTTTQQFEAQFNAQGELTGSTLTSTTTTYAKTNSATGVPDVFSEELDCSALRDALVDPEFEDAPDSGSPPVSQYSCTSCQPLGLGFATWSRFRWIVPPEHEGSYYRIDWDEVFFPKAFLDWQNNPVGPPPVLPTLTPKSWEWTGTALGPCCGEETDTYEDRLADEARKSPWGVMPPPDEAGRKELANVRVLCYRSPYTNLPWRVDGFPVIDLESYEQP